MVTYSQVLEMKTWTSWGLLFNHQGGNADGEQQWIRETSRSGQDSMGDWMWVPRDSLVFPRACMVAPVCPLSDVFQQFPAAWILA